MRPFGCTAVFIAIGTLGIPAALVSQEPTVGADASFPVEATVVVDGKFQRCEGIAFNGEGDLYVAGNAALWRVSLDGEVTKIADLYTNLGLAAIGPRDILMADFGPTSRFDHGPNDDGIVWRITPEGDKARVVDGGIGDPNFVLVRPDGSFLVSDVFTDAVGHPNGLALSDDGSTLFVAQIFTSLRPLVIDDRVWAIPLENGMPAGLPRVIARLGDGAANDGLAMDELGRIYVAANGQGKIWRVDPTTDQVVLIAENMPGVASLAFGQGRFDHHALYATSTRTGRVWKVDVGVRGATLHR